jgi:hypothetical protein
MEDEKKDQEQREEQVQSDKPEEVDADQVFSEAIGEAPEVDGKDQGTPEEKPAVKPEEEKEEAPPKDEDQETLKKRLADTQKWGHELSGEVAALKKKIEEIESAKRETERAKADEIPENVKSFYEDFPGFSDAVQYEARKLLRNTLGDVDLKQIQDSLQRSEGQRQFERLVVHGVYDDSGKYVDGHADAYRVMASPEFRSWADEREKVSPGFLDVAEPLKAIEVISQFKEHMAEAGARRRDEDLKSDAARVKEFASGGVPQGNRAGGDRKTNDDEDPEKIFGRAAGVIK